MSLHSECDSDVEPNGDNDSSEDDDSLSLPASSDESIDATDESDPRNVAQGQLKKTMEVGDYVTVDYEERNSNPPKCFFTPVTDRSAATLIPIITKWILPGTTILSDCWKAYSSLEAEGYTHCTVNHSVHFVSESGTHTNNIESHWNSLKKSLPKYGTNKDLYMSYFSEYCIRCKFTDSASDKFLEVLRLISLVYNPTRNSETVSENDHQPPELSAQVDTTQLLPSSHASNSETEQHCVDQQPALLSAQLDTAESLTSAPDANVNSGLSDCKVFTRMLFV